MCGRFTYLLNGQLGPLRPASLLFILTTAKYFPGCKELMKNRAVFFKTCSPLILSWARPFILLVISIANAIESTSISHLYRPLSRGPAVPHAGSAQVIMTFIMCSTCLIYFMLWIITYPIISPISSQWGLCEGKVRDLKENSKEKKMLHRWNWLWHPCFPKSYRFLGVEGTKM